MQTSHNTLKNIIFTGLFAAIIFIGISLLRIPIPAMVGRPFIHFGNPLMVLAILFLGGRLGGLAAVIGLGGFDLLNGYAATSWLTALEAIVMAIVVSALVKAFKHNDQPRNIIIIGILAGLTKIVTSYLTGVVEALMVGSRGRCLPEFACHRDQLNCNGHYRASIIFYSSATLSSVHKLTDFSFFIWLLFGLVH